MSGQPHTECKPMRSSTVGATLLGVGSWRGEVGGWLSVLVGSYGCEGAPAGRLGGRLSCAYQQIGIWSEGIHVIPRIGSRLLLVHGSRYLLVGT